MEPGNTIRDIEYEIIAGLINSGLDVEHFLGIYGRLVENFAIVLIIKRHGLHFEITMEGGSGNEECYITRGYIWMDNLKKKGKSIGYFLVEFWENGTKY